MEHTLNFFVYKREKNAVSSKEFITHSKGHRSTIKNQQPLSSQAVSDE